MLNAEKSEHISVSNFEEQKVLLPVTITLYPPDLLQFLPLEIDITGIPFKDGNFLK